MNAKYTIIIFALMAIFTTNILANEKNNITSDKSVASMKMEWKFLDETKAPPRWRLVSIQHEPDIKKIIAIKKATPYKLFGDSKTGRIVNIDGKMILKSDENMSIHDLEISEDGEWLLVGGGDAKACAYNPKTRQRIFLPRRFSGENALGASWRYWISPRAFIGTLCRQPKEVCCESHNVGETHFSLFNVATEKAERVEIPPKIKTPWLEIVDVSPEGYLHISSESSLCGSRDERDWGWFKIEPTNTIK